MRCWLEALKRVRFASGNAWAPRAFGRAQDRSPTQYASTRGRKTCASHECTLQEGLRAYGMTLTTACITITSAQSGLRRLWSQLDRRQVLRGRYVTVCQRFQSSTELTLRCLLPAAGSLQQTRQAREQGGTYPKAGESRVSCRISGTENSRGAGWALEPKATDSSSSRWRQWVLTGKWTLRFLAQQGSQSQN